MKKEAQLFECEFCHGMTPTDDRGHCSACGAPRDASTFLAQLDKYHQMELDMLRATASQTGPLHNLMVYAACSTDQYVPSPAWYTK
jgi:hypothetical protein